MIIRPANEADAVALAKLRFEFRAAMRPPSEAEGAFVERCAKWMEESLRDGGAWRCWVACDGGGEVVGHLWLQLIEKVPNPVPELEWLGYITNVYVRPGARDSGAGERLMEAAMAFCRERGVDSVVLWPTERSRTLYGRHGFVEPVDMMEAVLDPGRNLP